MRIRGEQILQVYWGKNYSYNPVLTEKYLFFAGRDSSILEKSTSDETTEEQTGEQGTIIEEPENVDPDYTIYRVDLQTMEEIELVTTNDSSFSYKDGQLYYLNADDGDRLYCMDESGNNNQLIIQTKNIDHVQVTQEGILYRKLSADKSGWEEFIWCDSTGENPESLVEPSSWWRK